MLRLPAKSTNWDCPSCHRTATVPDVSARIVCACGYVRDDMPLRTTLTGSVIDELRSKRLATCVLCVHYRDQRCVRIDLGCRRSFFKALDDQHSRCPERKWNGVRIQKVYVQPSVRVLNLLYHVCPLRSNDVWRGNVRQLTKRLRIFNGRKVVAVATGDKLHNPQVVRDEFRNATIEYLEVPNDMQLREVASFLPLLESVASDDPEEASFYAHTKGNSTRDNALGAEMWRNEMYHSLLDKVNVCRDLLWSHPCVGTHKMQFPLESSPYPSGLQHGNWLYAGTFFWFRHRDVYSHPQWREIPADRYGAEAWLSGLFDASRAATVFQPWPASEYPTPSPYDPALYLWPIRDV